MKMSSAMATRMKIVALSTLFALSSACSGDKKTEGEELETTGEEAAAPAVTDEAADEAPVGAPAPAPSKKKKGNNKKKKGGGKKQAPKKKGA